MLSPAEICARAAGSVARRARLLGCAVARQASLLPSYARRQGKLAALQASIHVLWAVTTSPDIVHSYVDDVADDVARHVAATASNAYTHVWAQLSVASSALAARLRHYSPASIYARLVVASSTALAAALDLSKLAYCCADKMLSRVVCLLVLKQLAWRTS